MIGNNFKINTRNKGFTLIELLVVVGIFGFVALALTQIFSSYLQAQRKSASIQNAISDASFYLEELSRDIRDHQIVYNKPCLNSPSETDLVVQTAADKFTWYNYDAGNAILSKNLITIANDDTCDQTMNAAGFGGVWDIGDRKVLITEFKFVTVPASDPYELDVDGTYLSDTQPRVTIDLIVENVPDNPADVRSFNLQTTVSSRYYGR